MLHEGIQDDVHFGGIEEAVVGVLDREKTQAVPVREAADGLIGDDFVRCALDDQDSVRKSVQVAVRQSDLMQGVHKGAREVDLAVEASGDTASVFNRLKLFRGQDGLFEHLVHDDGRAAQTDPAEGAGLVVADIFQDQVAAEAGRADIEDLWPERFLNIAQDASTGRAADRRRSPEDKSLRGCHLRDRAS